MSKPLGYYLNSCTGEYAGQLQNLIDDLDAEDKLGLIEWLTHNISESIKQLRDSLETETE